MILRMSTALRASLGLSPILLTACASRVPRAALALTPQSLEMRQKSSRRFSTPDEKFVLSACAGLLLDLGFTIENSETDLGLIVASKDRTAVEAGQVTSKFVHALIFRTDLPIDHVQRFRASIVSYPRDEGLTVRVTFQRIVWDDRGHVSRMEPLDDPKLYQDFFARLSKALFLEAQEL